MRGGYHSRGQKKEISHSGVFLYLTQHRAIVYEEIREIQRIIFRQQRKLFFPFDAAPIAIVARSGYRLFASKRINGFLYVFFVAANHRRRIVLYSFPMQAT
jgi:hypothetical protein